MALVGAISQPTRPVFGLLTLAANETLALTEAVFSRVATAPGDCRGFEIKLRSGAVKILDKVDSTDGWTLTASGFGDDTASSLEGLWIKETAGAAAEVEIICRTGGAS